MSGDGGFLTAVPDRWLDDRQLSAARSVLRRVVPEDRILLAFVSGSLAAGLGHGLSDVDVYLAVQPGTDVPGRGFREDGYIVQVNPLTSAHLELIARACNGYQVTPGDRWQLLLSDLDLQRALRYAISTVLADNTGGLVPAAGRARETLRRVLIARNAQRLGSFAEDALGSLQVGDELTALQVSQIAVECALEAALAASGDLYLGPKFLVRRLARCPALRELARDIWDGLRLPAAPAGLAATTGLVTRRLHLAVHLITSAFVDGWNAPAAEFPLFPGHWADGGPTRSPWVVPMRFSESWGFIGPDAGYRSSQGMVRVFRELDGRHVDDIHRGLAADPAFAGASRELLDVAIARLIEKGVVTQGGGA